MRIEEPDTVYVQVLEDMVEDVAIRYADATYVGFNDRRIDGTLDVWFTDATRIDGRNSTIAGGIVGWQTEAEKLDLGNSASDHVILRDATLDEVYGAGLRTRYMNAKDASIGTLTLSDAELDELILDDASVGTVDLSGAALRNIDAQDIDDYKFVVDDDTYIDEVPDVLADELGYGRVTKNEAELLRGVAQLGYSVDASVARGDLHWYVTDVTRVVEERSQVDGVLSSLFRKNMLEKDGNRYGFTTRGRQAYDYNCLSR